MYEDYFEKNGWLITKQDGRYFCYNPAEKEFAVHKISADSDIGVEALLRPVEVSPDPDFTCKPQFTAITLTTHCNMNCPYCYVKPITGAAVMEADEARRAVRSLAELSEEELVIFAWGGEPTQNPEALLAMIKEAKAFPQVKILLISNGVIDKGLLEKLSEFDNLAYQISFDGLASEDQQKSLVSREQSLDYVLQSLQIISKQTKRLALRSTVTSHNVAELSRELLSTASRFSNRIMVEHLHSYNGRAVGLRDVTPPVNDYVDLIFKLVPEAESAGIHVKVLPLDQIRAGGPNDKMNFLNVLSGDHVVASNAIIHPSHPDFEDLKIGSLVNGRIEFDYEKNDLLSGRYLKHYKEQCKDCFARSICRGSVQRYLFITNESLAGDWDDLRCQYYKAVLARWMEEMVSGVSEILHKNDAVEGIVRLNAPEAKIHYPVLAMPEGFTLTYRPFA